LPVKARWRIGFRRLELGEEAHGGGFVSPSNCGIKGAYF
jgi:hypothetical protein